MHHLKLLAGLVIATAAAWFTIGRVATMVGPGAALAVGGLVVVLFSAAFHRFWRSRSASEADWSPPAGIPAPPVSAAPPPARPARRPLPRIFLLGVVGGVIFVIVGFQTWQMGSTASPPYSGGIGSVSAGISEAIVETVLAAAVVGFVVLVYGQFGRRGRTGGDSQ